MESKRNIGEKIYQSKYYIQNKMEDSKELTQKPKEYLVSCAIA
jgi:hypothetical protein